MVYDNQSNYIVNSYGAADEIYNLAAQSHIRYREIPEYTQTPMG